MNNINDEVLYLNIQELLNKYGEDREAFSLHLSVSVKTKRHSIEEYFEDIKHISVSEKFLIFCLEQFLFYNPNFVNKNINQIIKHCIIYDLENLYSFSLNYFTYSDLHTVKSLTYFLGNFINMEEQKYIPLFFKCKAIKNNISGNLIDKLN